MTLQWLNNVNLDEGIMRRFDAAARATNISLTRIADMIIDLRVLGFSYRRIDLLMGWKTHGRRAKWIVARFKHLASCSPETKARI